MTTHGPSRKRSFMPVPERGVRSGVRTGFAIAFLALPALSGCAVNLHHIQDPPRAVAVTTFEPTRSMIYVARTDSGVIVVDLGWTGAGRDLRRGLRRVGSEPAEVRAVFLTHSHRDHIRGWRAVPHATFYLSSSEVPHFTGGRAHWDFASRFAAALFPRVYPSAEDLAVHGFRSDTTIVVGTDTVRAFLLPGHTAGSAAYLLRGVLFVGDALSYSALSGIRGASGRYTVDPDANRASLASLRERAKSFHVEWVCTAHAKCVRPETLRRKGLW